MRRPLPLIVLLPALLLAGCAQRMNPTPLPFRAGPDESVAESITGDPVVTVLYATDRGAVERNDGETRYTDDRGLALRFGVATVSFGEKGDTASKVVRQMERNQRPTIRVEGVRDFGRHWLTLPISDEDYPRTLGAPGPDDPIRAAEQEFIDEVNSRLSGAKRVLVYVPGFNTTFRDPLHLAAEFGLYMDKQVVPIAFSWPSNKSFFNYGKQMTRAETSIRNLRELLILLAEKTDAERIDVLSYSAGAPLVTDALHQIRLLHADSTVEEIREATKIGRVVYAGADEDFERFRNMYLDGFGEIAEAITLYSSTKDAGLGLSTAFVRGTTRLGRAMEALTENDRRALREATVTSIVDVEYAQRRAGGGDLWSHAYWYGNSWVSADLIAQLTWDLSPAERGLVRDDGEDASPAWRFPKDYPDRVRALFEARDD